MLQNKNVYTLTIALLGAMKLVLQSFGISIIDDQQIDAIANGVAAIVTIAGVVMTHLKKNGKNTSQLVQQAPTQQTQTQTQQK
jgi:uncharacterized membrane protein